MSYDLMVLNTAHIDSLFEIANPEFIGEGNTDQYYPDIKLDQWSDATNLAG